MGKGGRYAIATDGRRQIRELECQQTGKENEAQLKKRGSE